MWLVVTSALLYPRMWTKDALVTEATAARTIVRRYHVTRYCSTSAKRVQWLSVNTAGCQRRAHL